MRWAEEPGTSKLLDARLEVEGLLEPVRCRNEASFYVLTEVESFPLIPAAPTTTATGVQLDDEKIEDEKDYTQAWVIFDQKPPAEELLWFLCVTRRYTNQFWGLLLEEVGQIKAEKRSKRRVYRRIGLGRIITSRGNIGNAKYVPLTLV